MEKPSLLTVIPVPSSVFSAEFWLVHSRLLTPLLVSNMLWSFVPFLLLTQIQSGCKSELPSKVCEVVSFVVASLPEKGKVEREVGRYQLSTAVAESKKGKVYIVETILDTRTGKIVKRKKISLTKYKLPYRDGNRTIRED